MQTLSLRKTYQKYPEYKDSGVEWLGKIPEEWNAEKIVSVFDFPNEKVTELNFEPLSVTYGGIKKQIETAAKVAEGSSRKLVKVGDIVINARSDRKGAVGMSEYEGSVSLVYNVLRKRNKETDSKYFHYLFRSQIFSEEFYRWGRGIVDDLWTTRANEMKRILISVPQTENQDKIADYLDEKTSFIDQIIEKKKMLIELLKEKRTAIINQAVTKGLDPKVELVDSGIDWIGKIPKGWNVRRLKFLGQAIIGLTYSPDDVISEGGTLVLRSSNIKNGIIVLDDNVFVKKLISKKLTTKVGDILICSRNGSRKLVGKSALIDSESVGKTWGAFMTVFRSKYNKYISYFLKSRTFNSQLSTTLTSTINQLTTYFLNNIAMVLPPEIEQEKICKFLESKTRLIHESLIRVEESVEYLQEFKSSLISNVVTGKVKI